MEGEEWRDRETKLGVHFLSLLALNVSVHSSRLFYVVANDLICIKQHKPNIKNMV